MKEIKIKLLVIFFLLKLYARINIFKFLSTSVGQVWHGRLCGDTHFIFPSEFEGNHSPNLNAVQALNNPRNIFLINTNIILCYVFFWWNKQILFSLWNFFFFDLVIWIEYLASTVIVVWSNSSVVPSTRTNVSL